MNDGFDMTLLCSGALIKRGYSALIANVGKAVAIITLIVAALISFTEIGFSSASAESFSSTLIMMLIASYVMYFSLEDAGERLARESEEYKKAEASYDERRNLIGGEDITRLRQFCLNYQNEEHEYRRRAALVSLGYTEEEYDDFKKGKTKGAKAKRELSKIDRIKRSELNAQDLLSKGSSKEKRELKRPGAEKLLFMLFRLIPSTVCMLFTVSMMISAKDGMTFSSVMESLMKLSTLPIIGLKGYSLGYEYTMENELSWLNMKTTILDGYIKQRVK